MEIFGIVIFASGITLVFQSIFHHHPANTAQQQWQLPSSMQIGIGSFLLFIGGDVLGIWLFVLSGLAIITILIWLIIGCTHDICLARAAFMSKEPISIKEYEAREWRFIPGIPQSTLSSINRSLFRY